MTIGRTTSAVFSKGLWAKTAGKRIPLSGVAELTRRCNMGCQHCYANLAASDPQALSNELSASEWCRILDEVSAAGCFYLLLTGGEVLVRDDFSTIYKHAKRQGLLVTVFTNGTLVTPAIAALFSEWPPFQVEISIYGATAATHDRLTGRPGSFERCLLGIRLLLEHRVPVTLKTMALSLNAHELVAMKRLAKDELGVGFRFDALVNPRLDCSQTPLAVRLSSEQAVALDLENPERLPEWRRFLARTLAPPQPQGQEDLLFHCGAGVCSFAIDPLGGLAPCVLFQESNYDLRSGSFAEGWQGALAALRQRRASRLTPCSACHIKPMCGMCPATAVLEAGSPEEPVTFLCEVAHLRAEILGVAVPAHGPCAYCEPGPERDRLKVAAARLLKAFPNAIQEAGQQPPLRVLSGA